MNETSPIPRWIMIFGYFMAVLGVGFGVMFLLDAHPTELMDPDWYISVRNVAILAVLLIALAKRDVKLLFAAYFLRLIVELGDMTNQFLAEEFLVGLTFAPLVAAQAYGAWTLWKIANDE